MVTKLDQYIGQSVLVRPIANEVTLACKLTAVDDLGVTLADGKGADRFKSRFYPWEAVGYIDLETSDAETARVA